MPGKELRDDLSKEEIEKGSTIKKKSVCVCGMSRRRGSRHRSL